MGRGRGGHKGGKRVFSNPQEIEAQRIRDEKERAWRAKQHGAEDEDDDDEPEEKDEEEEATSSEDEEAAGGAKGVQNLIEVQNPNRVVRKPKNLDDNEAVAAAAAEPVQLSRREREELEKQRARANYAKLQAEGKTDQARADLARLAIVRQQREEAKRKKEEAEKLKAVAKTSAAEQRAKATRSVSADVTVKKK